MVAKGETLNIGELAKRTGLAASRIRFYESRGLLKRAMRGANGYRVYPPEAALTLTLITTAQQAGFSLDEIRPLLPSGQGDWDHGALLAALRRKVGEIAALQGKLARNKAQLIAVIRDIEARPDDLDCSANASRVLSRVLGKDG